MPTTRPIYRDHTPHPTTRYAAWDPTDEVIWGVGDSQADAISDAITWLEGPSPSELLERLEVYPITESLAAYVATQGGGRGAVREATPFGYYLVLPEAL